MFLAIVNTGNFEFVAIDSTVDDVHRSLLQAWRTHVRQLPDASPRLMTDMLRDGEVNIFPIEFGTVLRDGSPI